MAGTLFALLVLLLAVYTATVTGQGATCEEIDRCFDRFSEQARKIGHDQERFCQLLSEEIQCYLGVIKQCPVETRDHGQGRIVSAQGEREKACDASLTLSSLVVLTAGTTVAMFFGRLFS